MNRKKKDKKAKVESSDEEDNVYTAERLLRKRVVRNQVQYLVKWLNWSSAYNSWEPEDNILDERLIEEFKRNEKAIKDEKNKIKLSKLSRKINQSSIRNEKSTKSIDKQYDKKAISENESDDETLSDNKNIQTNLEIHESTSAIKNNSNQSTKSITLNRNFENNDKIESELIENSNGEDSTKIDCNQERETDLIITASELVKLNKNARSIKQPSSTITSNSLISNHETIYLNEDNDDVNLEQKSNKIQTISNQSSLLKSTELFDQTPINTNQPILKTKNHSSKQNLIINPSPNDIKQSNDLSFNVINSTNNLSNSIHLISNPKLNSNLNGNKISNTLPSSSSNYNLNRNDYNNVKNIKNIKNVNIVNPIISSNDNNHTKFNSSYFINQSPIKQTSFNNNLNKSLNRSQKIIETNNQLFDRINNNKSNNQLEQQTNYHNNNLLERKSKLTSFQETSEAILNSKRLIKHHLPPNIFWRHNNLVNQIVITDVSDKNNISVTIRESSSLNFLNRNSKRKKLKHLKKLKNNLI